MRNVEAADLPEFDPFELLPEPFAGVQLRSISG
jgi:hypothetical protein